MLKNWFRKKSEIVVPEDIEEVIEMIERKYEEKRTEVRQRYEADERTLQRSYEEKIDEGRLYEKELSFFQILEEAEQEAHPLEYTVERGSVHYKKVTFFRSKQSPNPFRIIVEEHKNCLFLGVVNGESHHVKDQVITLYYDKVKKRFQEYDWTIDYDYAIKHHMRMFLYDVMKHVKEDQLERYPFYKSEFRARDEFWKREHEWKEAYQQELLVLKEECDLAYIKVNELYEKELAPYRQERNKLEAQKMAELLLKREKEQEERKRLQEKEKAEEERLIQQLSGRVFDDEINLLMKRLFQYARQLVEKEHLLDIIQAHELRKLYEKDLQELWKSYSRLEEKKQKQEKPRFQRLLHGLETHLQSFEERMKEADTFDYEKKMTYMERKYLG